MSFEYLAAHLDDQKVAQMAVSLVDLMVRCLDVMKAEAMVDLMVDPMVDLMAVMMPDLMVDWMVDSMAELMADYLAGVEASAKYESTCSVPK